MQSEKIKTGTKLKIKSIFNDGKYTGYFVEHLPRHFQMPALNYIRVPKFKTVHNPTGICVMSEKEFLDRGEIA